MDINAFSERMDSYNPLALSYYSGYSDAGFWSSAASPNDVSTIICPDVIPISNSRGYSMDDFDPGILWDNIVWNDDGRICLFRIHPQDDKDLHQIAIDFSTTEGDTTPDWNTPSREDFIAEYNRQRDIIRMRNAYIPGSSK